MDSSQDTFTPAGVGYHLSPTEDMEWMAKFERSHDNKRAAQLPIKFSAERITLFDWSD